MKNLLCPEDIEWKTVHHLGMTDEHISKRRNDEFGVEWEQYTKKLNDFDFGKPKNYYYIDGQEKEYTDLQKLCDDWNEIKNFDDPNNEITWVKVIKTKTNS